MYNIIKSGFSVLHYFQDSTEIRLHLQMTFGILTVFPEITYKINCEFI